jgi:hypothetical protein
VNSPESISLDRGNGYMRLRFGNRTMIRWTPSLPPDSFIVEAPDGTSQTVTLAQIQAALIRLAFPTPAGREP